MLQAKLWLKPNFMNPQSYNLHRKTDEGVVEREGEREREAPRERWEEVDEETTR
jgi:hypothetical protein